MDNVSPSADQAVDLLQKMSLDSQSKIAEVKEVVKKSSSKSDTSNGNNQSHDRPLTPMLPPDTTMFYVSSPYPFYYGGYDGTNGEWNSRYLSGDVSELPQGVYGENGSMMYHQGYSYSPYSPYSPSTSPAPTLDGQLYGPQHYQYPTQYFQPMTPSNGPYTPNSTSLPQADVTVSAAADQKPLSVDTSNLSSGSGNSGAALKSGSGSVSVKSSSQYSSQSNGSFGRNSLPDGLLTSGYSYENMSHFPWYDTSAFPSGQNRSLTSSSMSAISDGISIPSRNQNPRPQSHHMGLHQPRPISGVSSTHGYMNRFYPNKLYGQYGNAARSTLGYGSNPYDSRGRGWSAIDGKYKPRGRGFYTFGNENADGMNEMNRGPRAKVSRNQKGVTPIVLAVKEQNAPVSDIREEVQNKSSLIPDREQYNSSDFPIDYTNAKFFIIKSYSEDDVHKSIKYNVWASTPNGNKKLDAAYREAKEKSGCPVFLFFSVNSSGQFVGVAEMVGPVDFNKNVEHWQQDKWTGCFDLKWHIVKDVPNSLLKHITLENNENKPVTNSRDTQEVKLEQGLQVIKIFKEHSSKTSLLDDFMFYEGRQKAIQEKKAKQQLLQKQVWEGKLVDESKKEGANGPVMYISPSLSTDAKKEALPSVQAIGDLTTADASSLGSSPGVPYVNNSILAVRDVVDDVANGF